MTIPVSTTPTIRDGGTILVFTWLSSVALVDSLWREKTGTSEDYSLYNEINERNEQTAFEASALNHFVQLAKLAVKSFC